MLVDGWIKNAIAIASSLYYLTSTCIVLSEEKIYRIVGNDGLIEYSDKKPVENLNGEIFTIHETNTFHAKKIKPRINRNQKPEIHARTVRILSPENMSVIPMGPGDFQVSVSVTPNLSIKEKLQLTLNEKPLGLPQRETNWSLSNISRGKHDLQVIRKNGSGEVIHKSLKVEILVLRPLRTKKRL